MFFVCNNLEHILFVLVRTYNRRHCLGNILSMEKIFWMKSDMFDT